MKDEKGNGKSVLGIRYWIFGIRESGIGTEVDSAFHGDGGEKPYPKPSPNAEKAPNLGREQKPRLAKYDEDAWMG